MNEIIKIINEWDPIKLFPLAPKDEYEVEAYKISKLLENPEIKEDELAEGIYEIFCEAFDISVFMAKKEECREIALKLIAIKK